MRLFTLIFSFFCLSLGAKLKAPLFSLGASGQIGKALVYFPWKGLNVVREHVVPSNPNTTLQQTQRAYITAAVALLRQAQLRAGVEMAAADYTAYAALAAISGKVMTWFNMVCKLYVDVIIAAKDPVVYHLGFMGSTLATDARPVIYFTEETLNTMAAGTFYLGSTRTSMIRSVAGVLDQGVGMDIAPGNGFDSLVVGNKYYWQFRPDAGDGCVGANSGIYHFVAT